MNTALAPASTALSPARRPMLLGWMARRLAGIRTAGGRRTVIELDRDEAARRHELRQEARRLREEQFRAGAFARLL
ncbi:hypothetical protein ACFWGP_09795 [Agromyces sp. NPDC127015]|uniref:hypothetical protein n=1 Tax=Agromyces sp. NPDC127015 TaxID=3347108 RepID=UPI00364B1DC1